MGAMMNIVFVMVNIVKKMSNESKKEEKGRTKMGLMMYRIVNISEIFGIMPKICHDG